jgi:superfamily II DNA or RNA helicase
MLYTGRDYQHDAMEAIFKAIEGGSKGVLCAMATGCGKAQPMSANVLTPHGFKRMRDIVVGDKVIGRDGKPHKVTGVFPQGMKPVFRVLCSDSTSTRCCEDHLWAVQTKSQKCRYGSFQVKPLKEIGSLVDGSGANRWFLPIVESVEFSGFSDPEVDPYLLGILIGDGSFRNNRIGLSTPETFIIEEVNRRLSHGQVFEQLSKYDWTLRTKTKPGLLGAMRAFLRSCGMDNCYSYEKFLPDEYKFGSVETRLEVLRGLMDTDGYVGKSSGAPAEFSTSSERLANDVLHIVRSLGGCSRIRIKEKPVYTHNGEKRIGRPCYRILVTLPQNPFKLPRKADLYNCNKIQGRTKAIVSITPDGEEECQCISVDAPDHLYVTDDFIVTHNTVLAGMLAQRMESLLFIVDREELAFQSQEKLQSITGRPVALECGTEYKAFKTNPTAKIVVAMSQSLIRRLPAYSPDRFQYMMEDESHHSICATRTSIRNYFTGKRAVIGFTATPERADGKALGLAFDTTAYEMDYPTAVDLGWLVPFKSRILSCTEMDLRGFKKAVEFNQEALRLQTEKEAVIERIATKTMAVADGRQTVIFAQTVKQSEQINRYLRSIGERSTHVDGKMPRYLRRERLAQFGLKNFQFICNCGLIEEGVDVPGIEVISMAAPIRSTARFIQRVGRGSRAICDLDGATPEIRRKQIADSSKPWFTVIDFIGQMDDHCSSMCFSGDLLGGNFDDEERKVAIRLASGKDSPDMPAIMAEAKEIVAKRRAKLTPQQEKEEARKRYQKAGRAQEQTWAITTTFDPYAVLRLDKRTADKEVGKDEMYGRSLDASQQYLKACQLTPAEVRLLGSKEIVYLARVLRARANSHCSYLQARQIHARGYDASNLSKADGNRIMNRIIEAGYVRPEEDGPNELYEKHQASKVEPVGRKQNYTFV